MYGYIYQITNIINNKSYIGYTKNFEYRMYQHMLWYTKSNRANKTLYRAFRKYGIDNFTCKIIDRVPYNMMSKVETYYVALFGTFKNGYNMDPGGSKGWPIMKGKNNPTYIHLSNNQTNIIINMYVEQKLGIRDIENLIGNKFGIGRKKITSILKEHDINIRKMVIQRNISGRIKGKNNPMYGVSMIQRMINKYGEELGVQRYNEWKLSHKGKNNVSAP